MSADAAQVPAMVVVESAWIDIGTLSDIPLRGARVVKTGYGCVAIFRTADNDVFALDDRCPHAGGPLSQGIVHGRSVTCPLHNWVISLETGRVVGPDDGETRTIAVRIDGDRILIDRASLVARAAA